MGDMNLNRGEESVDTIARLSRALRMMTEKFDQAEQRRAYWKSKAEAHGPCVCVLGPAAEGPDECCPEHGRTYGEWVERGDILANRQARIRDIVGSAAHCSGGPCALNHLAEIRAILFGETSPAAAFSPSGSAAWHTPPPESPFGNDFECCASGRCEVCSPGYVW